MPVQPAGPGVPRQPATSQKNCLLCGSAARRWTCSDPEQATGCGAAFTAPKRSVLKGNGRSPPAGVNVCQRARLVEDLFAVARGSTEGDL